MINPVFWLLDTMLDTHSERLDASGYGTEHCGVCGVRYREDDPRIRRRRPQQ